MTQAAPLSPLAVGPEEAARLASTTRSAVYKAIAEGRLDSFKMGKRRLILIKEIERWLKTSAKEGRK
ncbi:helix-turn-helix domain-containing protein [Pseudomonas sp. PL-6]